MLKISFQVMRMRDELLPWDFLLAYPASRHPSIRVSTKGGAAEGCPTLCGEAAKGRLPYGWVSGGWVGKEEIPAW